ncbi:MAG: MBL fold metallo-hydrolase [Bacteroidetes bacterium]|nr:MBL fold metallo-hydrolase [Bacteroidota bacterium]
MIKFLPLGGADEIGASCFYLNIDNTGILLDCGIHPRNFGLDALPKFEHLENLPLDFVFISHAHQDHIGSLPFLIQRFPHVIIYSTVQTKEISELTLHNAANILAARQIEGTDFKVYTHEEIDLLVRSIRGINYEEKVELRGLRHSSSAPIQFTFRDAGHILGSAAILIEYSEEKIFYTGDINLGDQSIMIGADMKGIRNIDTLILESTYGGTDSEKLGTWKSEEARFAKAANRILHKDGSILIPVFALGKTQELLTSIHVMMKSGKLTETNIYTGGISRDISRVYDYNRYLVRRSDPNLELKEIPQLDLLDVEDYSTFKKNPGIVLASSGMILPGTTSYRLLDFWLRQDSFAIFGVGYMDPETPGFRVVNSKRGDTIQLSEFSSSFKVNCMIQKFYFSSHSKREELLGVVDKTKPEKVILIHGEHHAKDWLGFNILRNFPQTHLYSAELLKEIVIN